MPCRTGPERPLQFYARRPHPLGQQARAASQRAVGRMMLDPMWRQINSIQATYNTGGYVSKPFIQQVCRTRLHHHMLPPHSGRLRRGRQASLTRLVTVLVMSFNVRRWQRKQAAQPSPHRLFVSLAAAGGCGALSPMRQASRPGACAVRGQEDQAIWPTGDWMHLSHVCCLVSLVSLTA